MSQTRTATLYRMVLPDHVCPFGVRAKQVLEDNGFAVEDNILATRAEVDAFEEEQGVATTPQVFIDGERIGGSDDLERHLALVKVAKPEPDRQGLSRPAALAIVATVLGASAVLGRRNAPDPSHPGIRRWYKRLDKPAYTPPDAAFGAVWPVLETGLAVGGYRLLRRPAGGPRNLAVGLWLLNTSMIGGWTELFFRRKELGSSAAASGAMIATGAAYVAAAARVDRPAAATGVPFVAWLGFATLLAERIWERNRRGDPST